MKDEGFLAEAKQLGLDLNPMTGDASTTIVNETINAPADAMAKAKAAIEPPREAASKTNGMSDAFRIIETPILIVGAARSASRSRPISAGAACPAWSSSRARARPTIRARPRSMRARWSSCAAGAWRKRCATRRRPRTFRTPRSIARRSPASRSRASSGPHHGGRAADHDQPGARAALQPDLARPDPARSRDELCERRPALSLALRSAASRRATA